MNDDWQSGDESNSKLKLNSNPQLKKPLKQAINSKSKSIKSFEDLNLSEELLNGLRSANINEPNRLQKVILPELMNKERAQDIFIKSRPHSGKKTSFLINSINLIDKNLNKPQVVILTPTVELAFYLHEQAKKLNKFTNIKISELTLDANRFEDTLECQLIVCTIDAFLNDLRKDKKARRSILEIDKLKCLIFDEIDILVSSDSKKLMIMELFSIFKNLQVDFKLQFFSTSLDKKVLEYVENKITDHLLILNQLVYEDCFKNYLQFYIYCECDNDKSTPDEKFKSLISILNNSTLKKIVIYILKEEEASLVNDKLKDDFKTILLSNESMVEQRLDAINQFNKNSDEQVILILNYPLIHGIQLDNLSIVINFDLPVFRKSHLEYFHRMTKCTTRDRPCFVINIVDAYSKKKLIRVEKNCQVKIIKLDTSIDN